MTGKLPETITIKIGSTSEVKLPGLATTGYEWNYAIDGDSGIIDIAKNFSLPQDKSPDKPGGNADEIFTITGRKKGTVTISFDQQRIWEKNMEPFHERKIVITVQ